MRRLIAYTIAMALVVAGPIIVFAWLAPYAWFTPTSGPVEYYELRVRTLYDNPPLIKDQRFRSTGPTSVVEFSVELTGSYWIDVWACAEDPVRRCGIWSPMRTDCADFNGDGTVGPRDLIAVAAGWGWEHDAADLELLRDNWRRKTVQVGETGLWRYVE